MPNWDNVYTEKKVAAATPSDVLINNVHLLPEAGEALDYACGLAANGLFLAKKGFQVKAWDLSEIAIDKINNYANENQLNLSATVYDLENNSVSIKNKFDVIVVSYFFHRESLRKLYDLLKKDGLLFYQTFSNQQYNEQGPAREAYRLKRNELIDVFSDMQILFYREDDVFVNAENAKLGVTYFVAKK